jgi:diguanylate cyclase (GGDEF)-like protein/PAS domain S-box-containing protein
VRRRIVLSLLVIVACAASGATVAAVHSRSTTAALRRLVDLHRIEELRQNLIIAIQTAQSDLYTANTALGAEVDVITENVFRLEAAARRCADCHHQPEVAARLDRVNTLVADYQTALSYYLTASADRDRIARLKLDAARIGSELLGNTEQMSIQASRKLDVLTGEAMQSIDEAGAILFVAIVATVLLGMAVAVWLTGSITGPVEALVAATRAIASGNLGYTIDTEDRSELGELARHFNGMSTALARGYADLQAQVREREHAEQALRTSEQRYALAARGANDGLWDWDLAASRVYLSPRWKSMLGHADAEVGDDPEEWFGRIHLEDRARVEAQVAEHLAGATPHFEVEYRILHADGAHLWVVCRGLAVRDEAGRPTRMAGSQTDITPRKRAEERLVHDALHDALTGLPNRALFIDRLGQLLAAAARQPQPSYAVLFLDLDRFKVVNDSLGHVIGDRLLVAVGERIGGCLRPSDTVARLGGDEFGVLLDGIHGPNDAGQVSQRILDALGESFAVDGHEIFEQASIGIALGAERYARPEDVLRDADVAMYQAKAKGKGCFVVFDAEMHGSVVARLRMESELRRAVEHGREFLLHYQPIVDLRTSGLVGLEALIRWQPPGRDLVHPADFVPLAEESGMILPIGEWAVAAACDQLRTWRERHPQLSRATMSVNISARQFAQQDVVARLERILREAGVDPRHVALEVTESAIMDDVTSSAAKLARLRDLGMDIHVDDFGTGYSSLSYLHRFPITALKIDRSFVAGLGANGESEELIRAIVSIAETLRFEVIAEGVETPEQLARLKNLRCRYAQGYLFARPMEPGDVERWATPRAVG